MLRGPQGVHALQEKRKEIRTLEEQNANLTRDIEAKKQRIERLKNDRSLQEVVVHDLLGKVHPGDTDFKESGQHIGPAPAKPDATSTSEQPK